MVVQPSQALVGIGIGSGTHHTLSSCVLQKLTNTATPKATARSFDEDMPTTLPFIPIELITAIIHQLDPDSAQLATCSIASRAFLPTCCRLRSSFQHS